MPLPNPSMSFTPFDTLPASDLNDVVENIEALQDGSAFDNNSIPAAVLVDGSVGETQLSDAIFLGSSYTPQQGTVLTNAYVTYATVTATSDGGKVIIDVNATVYNGSSGADRTFKIRVQCDGVTVRESLDLYVELDNNRRYTFSEKYTHTPSAASHTWTFQMLASINSAVVMDDPAMEVRHTK